MKSLDWETDDGLSSCSSFSERPTQEEIEKEKPVLPEIEHLVTPGKRSLQRRAR